MAETIKEIVKEICRIGCEQCSCKDNSEGCEKILNEYVERIREAADLNGDSEN